MKIGFALSGGGGKGGYSAGIAYSLWKNGITPDAVHGISVGALNGIMVATNQYEEMKNIWHTVTDDDVRKEHGMLKYASRKLKYLLGIGDKDFGYWSNEPLKKLVRKHIIGKTTVCYYYCGAVRIKDKEFVNFSIPKGTTFTEGNVDQYVSMIVASTAIPIIFEPVEVGGELYVDGGVKYQMPLKQITNGHDDSDYIIGISHKSARKTKAVIVRNDLDMAKWTLDVQLGQSAEYDFERFERINHMAKKGIVRDYNGKRRKYYPSHIFRPTRQLSPGTRFHHTYGKIDFLHGLKMAERFTLAYSQKHEVNS